VIFKAIFAIKSEKVRP